MKSAWTQAEAKHKKYVVDLIDTHLAYPARSAKHVSCPELRNFLAKHKEQIAIGDVTALERLIAITEDMGKEIGSGPYMARFMYEARKIFDYKYFTQDKVTIWCAYSLCRTSEFKVCPYCNQNYAFTLTTKDGQFRPTLDHFFPKFLYPFLALSLYNLVPSCYTCNSNLKGKTNFREKAHLHPFNMTGGFKFRVESTTTTRVDLLVRNRQLLGKFAVVVPDKPTHADVAVKNSIETFLLEYRFDHHRNDFLDFAHLRRRLTRGRLRDIQKIIGQSVDLPLLLGFDVNDFRNQIHGKIYRDLYDQFRPIE